MRNRKSGTSASAREPSSAPASRWRDALSDERITHLIKNAFRGTSRALQTRLSKHSVQYGHWTLLRVLWQTDGLTQRQLSEQAGVTEPSTFAALQRMKQLGYITRQRMPANPRQTRIFLTAKGAALRKPSVSAAKEVNRIALSGVSPADIAATRRTLLAIIENLDADPTGSGRARTPAASIRSAVRASARQG